MHYCHFVTELSFKRPPLKYVAGNIVPYFPLNLQLCGYGMYIDSDIRINLKNYTSYEIFLPTSLYTI